MSATTAAPPAPLTAAQCELLERRLLEERRRVLRALERMGRLDAESGATEGGRMPTHLAELGSETMQDTIDGVLSAHESRTLAEIDAALRRLYQHPDRFGLDEVTGEPIPFARLDILPWATRVMKR
jgi:RNA polymerase-binding transcription factor DksA